MSRDESRDVGSNPYLTGNPGMGPGSEAGGTVLQVRGVGIVDRNLRPQNPSYPDNYHVLGTIIEIK